MAVPTILSYVNQKVANVALTAVETDLTFSVSGFQNAQGTTGANDRRWLKGGSCVVQISCTTPFLYHSVVGSALTDGQLVATQIDLRVGDGETYAFATQSGTGTLQILILSQ